MKKLALILCCCFLSTAVAQKYTFVADSLRLISMEELLKKGPPSNDFDSVYYEDGAKADFQTVLPFIENMELTPKMFVDNEGNYTTLVVVNPMNIPFDYLEANTQYSFIPKNLRLLPTNEVFKRPPSNTMKSVFYEDGTPVALEIIMPKLMKRELTPKMYVDKDLKYKALVVQKQKD